MALAMDFTGKVALVTGGSRGIGAACVRLFAQAGASVMFNYQKSAEAAQKVAIAAGRDRCAAVQADLIGEGAEEMLVQEAVSRFGYLDILVVNHATWEPQEYAVDQMDDEQWRSTMAVNLDSAFLLVKHAVRAMRHGRRNGGHIVMVSSTAAQRGQPFHCDYAATKGALISMVKGLSKEAAERLVEVRVRFLTPHPGPLPQGERENSSPAASETSPRASSCSPSPLVGEGWGEG